MWDVLLWLSRSRKTTRLASGSTAWRGWGHVCARKPRDTRAGPTKQALVLRSPLAESCRFFAEALIFLSAPLVGAHAAPSQLLVLTTITTGKKKVYSLLVRRNDKLRNMSRMEFQKPGHCCQAGVEGVPSQGHHSAAYSGYAQRDRAQLCHQPNDVGGYLTRENIPLFEEKRHA